LALVEEAIGAIRWRRAGLALCRLCRIGGSFVYERAIAATDHPGRDRSRDIGGPDHHRCLVRHRDAADVVPSCR
jgi:hypothetical protein